MTLKLTPFVLKQAYDLLNETEPFVGWNLPDSHDVRFKVVKTRKHFAYLHFFHSRNIVLEVSQGCIGHTYTLIETMAHEMIHVYQYMTGMAKGNEHNAAFYKLAREVCRVHGFDPKSF